MNQTERNNKGTWVWILVFLYGVGTLVWFGRDAWSMWSNFSFLTSVGISMSDWFWLVVVNMATILALVALFLVVRKHRAASGVLLASLLLQAAFAISGSNEGLDIGVPHNWIWSKFILQFVVVIIGVILYFFQKKTSLHHGEKT